MRGITVRSTPIPLTFMVRDGGPVRAPRSSADRGPDDARDVRGDALDMGLVGAFDHDPGQRFGAGIAQEDAPGPVHGGLEAPHPLLDAGDRVEGALLPDWDI